MRKLANDAKKAGEVALFFMYYAGHGVMENYTKMVCNDEKKFKPKGSDRWHK